MILTDWYSTENHWAGSSSPDEELQNTVGNVHASTGFAYMVPPQEPKLPCSENPCPRFEPTARKLVTSDGSRPKSKGSRYESVQAESPSPSPQATPSYSKHKGFNASLQVKTSHDSKKETEPDTSLARLRISTNGIEVSSAGTTAELTRSSPNKFSDS
jgi:hypothetical protein